jgi:hypothetical protein
MMASHRSVSRSKTPGVAQHIILAAVYLPIFAILLILMACTISYIGVEKRSRQEKIVLAIAVTTLFTAIHLILLFAITNWVFHGASSSTTVANSPTQGRLITIEEKDEGLAEKSPWSVVERRDLDMPSEKHGIITSLRRGAKLYWS